VTERSGSKSERSGSERSGSERSGSERSGSERSEHERTAAMLNHVFTFDPPLLPDDLRWYYDDNPAGTAAVGRVEEGGRRLGNYALVPLPLARGDGSSITLGVGVDLAVDPDARGKGTFRSTVEDSYARGTAAGLDGILGVANANSAPRMVSTLGWRALPDLPARMLLPGLGRHRYRTRRVDAAYLASADFDAATAGGFAPQGGPAGFAPVWTPEQLRWRLAKRRARYWVHASPELLAVSTVTKVKGIPFAVLLKTLPRSTRPVDGGALVRHLQRVHLTPFVIHWGRAPQLRLRGVTLPRRFLPSPLALVLHAFTDHFDRESFSLEAFEFLDFDAY
jgi:GNAT superfamily N-acetyltransferase